MSKNPITKPMFPSTRLSTIDLGRVGIRKHHVAALLEIDVTRARHSIRSTNRGGSSTVSFLGWLVKNVANSLQEHPQPRTGRRSIPPVKRMDVTIMVERLVEGERIPLPVLIADAHQKSATEIEREIQRARTEVVDGASIVTGRNRGFATRAYNALPGPIRRWLLCRAVANPERLQRTSGSVIVTSVGMGGRVKGWFIPKSMHPVCVGVGAVTPKAVVMNGAIQPREVLHMTVLVDHQVVDGAPASRWINAMVKAMELGRELSLN